MFKSVPLFDPFRIAEALAIPAPYPSLHSDAAVEKAKEAEF